MQRRIPLVLAVTSAAALLLAGCSGVVNTGVGSSTGSAADQTIPAACSGSDPYLAVALPNLTSPYYVTMKKTFETQGAAAGYNVEVQIANDDDAQQLAQVQTMLQKKPCALAINPVKSEPAAAIVKAANDAGVPVFTLNVNVDEDSLKAQGAYIAQYVGADNATGGKQIGEEVLKNEGADAALTIGFVTEPDEVPTRQRDEAFEKVIAADPNAKVVAKVDGNIKPDDSLKVATELMSGHPDINVIFANAGPHVFGALQALGDKKNVKVFGFCAADEPLTDVYVACVAQEPALYAQQSLDSITAFAAGKPFEAVIANPLKLYHTGETPAPGQVG
jgi:ribose transport system substrate-binding protein